MASFIYGLTGKRTGITEDGHALYGILTSGYSEQEATHRFAGKGLAGFVQKPFRAAHLMSVVRQVLEGGRWTTA